MVAREVGFSKIHIFPFSARRGTAAANMAGQIAAQEKQARSRRLAEVEQELLLDYFAKLQGRELQVLFESLSQEASRIVGTSCRYATVEVPSSAFASEGDLLGRLCVVRAGKVLDGRIQASRIPVTNPGRMMGSGTH